MPPKTGKAAKESGKAIPALKEKKWTLIIKMAPKKAAIFRSQLHSDFKKLNFNFGNHAPGCGCGM